MPTFTTSRLTTILDYTQHLYPRNCLGFRPENERSLSTYWQPVQCLLSVGEMSAHCAGDWSLFKRRVNLIWLAVINASPQKLRWTSSKVRCPSDTSGHIIYIIPKICLCLHLHLQKKKMVQTLFNKITPPSHWIMTASSQVLMKLVAI